MGYRVRTKLNSPNEKLLKAPNGGCRELGKVSSVAALANTTAHGQRIVALASPSPLVELFQGATMSTMSFTIPTTQDQESHYGVGLVRSAVSYPQLGMRKLQKRPMIHTLLFQTPTPPTNEMQTHLPRGLTSNLPLTPALTPLERDSLLTLYQACFLSSTQQGDCLFLPTFPTSSPLLRDESFYMDL